MNIGGSAEVAAELGVSRQRLLKLRERPDFPSSVTELALGPVWDLDEIGAWKESKSRRSGAGRPRAEEAANTLGGRFALEDEIKSGGFGVVYRAVDKKKSGGLAAMVAVKILSDKALFNAKAVRRFKRERRLGEALQHPNVIEILDHGETPSGVAWYAMPLALGDLDDRLPRLKGRPGLILDLMRQVCGGVQYIHDQKIYHRDLKPGNILSFENGRWVVSDFGLAVDSARTSSILTATGRLGTDLYAAPEQKINPRDADHRADIFSLGKILQEVVTGTPPGTRKVPAGPFRTVILRATEDDRDKRYQSVADFLTAVETAAEAPGTRWETTDEIVERLAGRIRTADAAQEDVLAVMEWAESLDEDETEDMMAMTRVVPYLRRPAIRFLWRRHPESFTRVYERYTTFIGEHGFEWSHCDVMANFCERVVENTDDSSMLRMTITALAELAKRHHRYHVREVFAGLLQAVRDTEQAMAALDGVRAASLWAVEWSTENLSLRSLYPTLGKGIQDYLAGGSD